MMRHSRTRLALLAATVLLAACGGGGGGTPPITPSDNPPPNTSDGDSTPTTPTTPNTSDGEDTPTTPTPSPGGTTSTTTGTTTTGGPPTTTTGGPTPDGILWDHDGQSDTPDIAYVFQRAYTLKDIVDGETDDPTTPFNDTTQREDYIRDNILRDANYAALSAQTIPGCIDPIRSGYADEDCTSLQPRLDDAIPLIDFGADREPANPHPLVKVRGVSGALDRDIGGEKGDITLIQEQIDLLDRYLARAEAAKQALEDEITRLEGVAAGQDRLQQPKQTRFDMLQIEVDMLLADAVSLRNEADTLDGEAREFTDNPTYTQDPSAVDEAVRCTDAVDCRARAAERRLEATGKDDERGTKEVEARGLQTEIQGHDAAAADIRNTRIPGLRGHVDTVQGHIDGIKGLRTLIVATHEADKQAADPSNLARLIQNRLTGIALEGAYPRNTDGDTDVDSVDITALQGVRGRFAADRNPDELARGRLEAAEDLDEPGDVVVFARAPMAVLDPEDGEYPAGTNPGGTPPVAALRVIARTHSAGVQELTLDAQSGDPQALRDLDTGLGRHWRMNLDGHAPSEATPATDWSNTGRGDSTPGTFRGIYGTFYCTSATCADPATASTFGAGWYFTPSVPTTTTNPNARNSPFFLPSTQPTRFRYEDEDGDGVYEPLWYVDYGMWLTWDGDLATDLARLGIETRVGLVGPDGGTGRPLDLTTPNTPSNNLAASATYSGTARGLSARTTTTGGVSSTASGHFTADVMLNARFGIPIADPGDGSTHEARLGGTITNFRPDADQGSAHVNPAWRITLMEGVLSGGGEIRAQSGEYRWDHDDDESTPDQACGTLLNCGDPRTGVFTDDDVTGRWSAQGYIASGDVPGEGARPTGFYGGFVAAFDDDGIDQGTERYPNGDGNLYDDGAAIGVYSAE